MHFHLGFLVLGLVAGALAGGSPRRRDASIVIDLCAGVVGAYAGGGLAIVLGVAYGTSAFGAFLPALLGAAVLLVLVRVLREPRLE